MASRWFLVPQVGTGTVSDPYRPKYEGEVEDFAGGECVVDGTTYYVVKFYGTTSALDTVESYSDATSVQELGFSESDVAAELNERTGHSYTLSEWEQRFLAQ